MLGLPPSSSWRVIKFAQGKEYGITPSHGDAAGSGTRRLYDLDNVCEIGLALRLLETGLRSKAIGKVIRQLQRASKLSKQLELPVEKFTSLFVVILRHPKTGRPLDEKREQISRFAWTLREAESMRQERPNWDFILVPVGPLFLQIRERIER